MFMPLVFALSANGQDILFQSDFSAGDGFVVRKSSEDNEFDFNYDYADFDGIPEAPHAELTGGAAQRGLKLESNLGDRVAAAIAVATDGLQLSGKYAVQVDIWLNFNFPAGTAGTTEFGGLSVGHDVLGYCAWAECGGAASGGDATERVHRDRKLAHANLTLPLGNAEADSGSRAPAWEPTGLQALPARVGAEPLLQCIPRRSPGTSIPQ